MDDWSKNAITQLALQALEQEREAIRQALRANLRARRTLHLLVKDVSTQAT